MITNNQQDIFHTKEYTQDIEVRFRKIKGQLNGIEKMIEGDRYTIDILTQISAVKSALDSLAIRLLERHTQTVFLKESKNEKEVKAINELIDIFRRFM
jgi:CsoR family transcriptional regulator, copper-sensing transcriptional repressor